jgi:hypothetical protein
MSHRAKNCQVLIISPGVNSALMVAPAAVVAAAGGVHPSGFHPAGGTWNTCAAPMTQIRKTTPRIMNVRGMVEAKRAGSLPRSLSMTGAKMRDPAPNPRTASPTIVPRLSGNHLTQVAIGVTYANPTPRPPRIP